MDFKSFLFRNILAPKAILFDQPGVIINKVPQKYGRKTSYTRPVYHFEDVFAQIQLVSKKQIGLKETKDIWYKIGKDATTSYFMWANARKPPAFLIGETIKYICTRFRLSGMNVCTNIEYGSHEKKLRIYGENNVFWRKTGIGDTYAGIISGIMSFLHGTNMEAIASKKEQVYEITCNPDISKRHISDIDSIKEIILSNKELVEKHIETFPFKNYDLPSFSKMILFKKISLDENIFSLEKAPLIGTQIDTAGLIIFHYKKDYPDFPIEQIIAEQTRKVTSAFLSLRNKEEREKCVIQIISALGWGIPVLSKENKKITLHLIMGSTDTTRTLSFFLSEIQGMLEAAYEKPLRYSIIKKSTHPYPVITAQFS